MSDGERFEIKNIRKRNGKLVQFDKEKITEAIWKAAQSVGGKDRKTAERLAGKVVTILEYQFGKKEIPTVEEIQDIVEKVLIKSGHARTAKAYILYRQQKAKIRETKHVMVDAINTISEYLEQTDWRVRENSNEAFSFSGLLLHTAGKVMSNYNLTQMYTSAIAEAHRKGYVHIHDLSHGVIGYCCGHSLKNLLLMGFGGVPNKVDCKPAKHMSTIVHQMVNYIGCLQMEFAGAQAFSVHPKETIIIRDRDGNISVERIGEFCDRFIEGNPKRWIGPNNIEYVDIGSLGFETLSFNDKGDSLWKPIRKAIRHPVTDPLHMVRTNKGVVSASRSHSLFSLNSHQYLGMKERLLLKSIENNGKKLYSYEMGERARTLGIKAPEKVVQKLISKGMLNSEFLTYKGETRHFSKYTLKENKKNFALERTKDLNRFSREVKTNNKGTSNIAVLSKMNLPQKREVDLYKIIKGNRRLRRKMFVKIDNEKQLKKDIQSQVSLKKLSLDLGRYKTYVWGLLKNKKIPFELFDKYSSVKGKDIRFATVRSSSSISRLLKGRELVSFTKLIAWYLSEGYATKYWIGISQKDREHVQEIRGILDDLGLAYHVGKRDVRAIVISGIAAHVVKELCGKGSNNKRVPSFIFGLSDDIKRAFIEEIVKGDGTRTDKGWIYTSTSNKLVTGLNLLATSLDWKTSIKMRHLKNFEEMYRERLTRYDLVLNTKITSRIERHGNFESSVVFENTTPNLNPDYEYDLSVEDTESFVGGVGLFAMHNSSVDTLLAPFVRADELDYKQVKQNMQQLVFSLNIPSRWGCFSEDTEILTDKGWRKGTGLKEGDVIATFNTDTEEIEYLPVLGMTRYRHKGKMYRLRNRIMDQLVTPNHRVLRRIHNFDEGVSESKYVFEEADRLRSKIPLIPLGGRFRGLEIDDELVRSLAWIVSEGSICRNERIVIHQSHEMNPENCDEIRHVLDKSGFGFNEMRRQSGYTGRWSCTRFRLSRPNSREIYQQYFPDYVKRIPEEFRDLSTHQARIFIDTYMKADGSVTDRKLFTKSKEDADMLQEIIAKTGWGSTLRRNRDGIYIIRVIKHDYTTTSSIETADYDGLVWCPTTRNNTVVVRRKGKVFISGNSQFPFSNVTFDWDVPEDMRGEHAIVGGKEQSYTYEDVQEEADLINKAFMEVLSEGDAKGRIFSFPIPTYNVTKDFRWDTENAKALFGMTARYGAPYFQNYVGSDLDPKSIRAMCLHPREEIIIRKNSVMEKTDMGTFARENSTGFDAEGWSDIKDNVEVLSLNPDKMTLEWKKVKKIVKKGSKKMVVIRTRDGKSIRVTPEHPVSILTPDGIIEKPALSLSKGEYLLSIKSGNNNLSDKIQNIGSYELDCEMAKLMGFFMADGNYLYENRSNIATFGLEKGIQLTFPDSNEDSKEIIELAENKLGVKAKLRTDPRYGTLYAYFYNSKMIRELSEMGLSKYERLPPQIWNSPQNVIESFLEGFFLGDGYEKRREIHINDPKLARELVILYNIIGKPVTFRKREKSQIIYIQGGKERKNSGIFGNPPLYARVPTWAIERSKIPGSYYTKNVGLKRLYFYDAHNDFTMTLMKSDVYPIDIIDIEEKDFPEELDFFDIELEGNHRFVHSLGTVTHNCCRLNINQNELMKRPGSMWGPGDQTGSLGVFTINMNRLGYEARNEEEFLDRLDHYMRIGRDSLEIKRRVVEKNMRNNLMPFTKVYLGNFNNHFSTIGLVGFNEACLNLLGEDIAGPNGKALAIKTLNFMRDRLREFQVETGSLYNLEATPAEGASYRLAREDKKLYGRKIKTAGENVPYLTNSTQLPVDYTDDLVMALEHQNDIQPLYTGGTIFHTFLGESMSDWESAMVLVRKIAHNTALPYFSITPTFTVCPVHGFIKGKHTHCTHETNGG